MGWMKMEGGWEGWSHGKVEVKADGGALTGGRSKAGKETDEVEGVGKVRETCGRTDRQLDGRMDVQMECRPV